MASGTTGIWLNEDEIDQTRKAAHLLTWSTSASEMFNQAESLFQSGQAEEAAALYVRLAALPMHTHQIELARKRTETSPP